MKKDILKNLKSNETINNILWLLIDKSLIIVLQFFVGIKIANYYGVKEYGIYSYAISLIAFSPLILEIINDRVIKKYFKDYNNEEIISTVNIFKGGASLLILLIILLLKYFVKMESNLFYLLLLLSIDNIFTNFTFGIKSYFEYKLESKIIVQVDAKIRIFYYFFQYISILLNYSLIVVILIRVFGSFIRMFILFFKYKKIYLHKIKFKYNKLFLLKIILESKYLWLSSISYILYAQIDKIMIKNMINIEEVGIYNIAFQLMTLTLVPIEAIRVSCYKILWKKYNSNYEEYINLYKKITLFLTQGYILLSITSYILLPLIFNYVYTYEYNGAILIFNALLIGIVIRGNETFQYTHYTFKELTKYLLYKQLFGLVINIILNYFLIIKIGVEGAALATSLTLLFTRLIFDSLFEETREIFKIQIKAFNSLILIKYIKDNLLKKY